MNELEDFYSQCLCALLGFGCSAECWRHWLFSPNVPVPSRGLRVSVPCCVFWLESLLLCYNRKHSSCVACKGIYFLWLSNLHSVELISNIHITPYCLRYFHIFCNRKEIEHVSLKPTYIHVPISNIQVKTLGGIDLNVRVKSLLRTDIVVWPL